MIEGMITPLEASFDIAREHVRWARARSRTASDIVASVGEPLPNRRAMDWADAIAAVARQWREMQAAADG